MISGTPPSICYDLRVKAHTKTFESMQCVSFVHLFLYFSITGCLKKPHIKLFEFRHLDSIKIQASILTEVKNNC